MAILLVLYLIFHMFFMSYTFELSHDHYFGIAGVISLAFYGFLFIAS